MDWAELGVDEAQPTLGHLGAFSFEGRPRASTLRPAGARWDSRGRVRVQYSGPEMRVETGLFSCSSEETNPLAAAGFHCRYPIGGTSSGWPSKRPRPWPVECGRASRRVQRLGPAGGGSGLPSQPHGFEGLGLGGEDVPPRAPAVSPSAGKPSSLEGQGAARAVADRLIVARVMSSMSRTRRSRRCSRESSRTSCPTRFGFRHVRGARPRRRRCERRPQRLRPSASGTPPGRAC